jgi:hypothetical protein
MARKGRWSGSLLPCMVETDLEQDHDVYWDVATMGWGARVCMSGQGAAWSRADVCQA